MNVSAALGILDLSSPKFGLDGLGIRGEKMMIRVLLTSNDGCIAMAVFGSYTIGGRHMQIASREMERLGSEVNVVSVSRYGLKDFVEGVNNGLEKQQSKKSVRLVWESGKTFLNLNQEKVAITFQDMYPTAGRACGIFECLQKSVKVILGSNVELFDLQRRKLSGLRLNDDKLILEREFQILINEKVFGLSVLTKMRRLR